MLRPRVRAPWASRATIWIALVFCMPAVGFQKGTDDFQSDVYSIYSLLLRQPRTSHGADLNPTYLIRNVTVPGNPTEPCVRPPASESLRWAEVIADFNRRQSASRTLEPRFTIPKPFRLLSKAECDEFIKTRFLPLPSSFPPIKELFPGLTDLFSLSDVYFDQSHTLALTAISSWCGGLCALYEWKVFAKGSDGNWTEKSWITCTTMS